MSTVENPQDDVILSTDGIEQLAPQPTHPPAPQPTHQPAPQSTQQATPMAAQNVAPLPTQQTTLQPAKAASLPAQQPVPQTKEVAVEDNGGDDPGSDNDEREGMTAEVTYIVIPYGRDSLSLKRNELEWGRILQ